MSVEKQLCSALIGVLMTDTQGRFLVTPQKTSLYSRKSFNDRDACFGSQNMRSKPLIGRIGLSAKKTNVIRGSLRRQLRDKTEIGQITLRRFAVGHSPNADRPLLRDLLRLSTFRAIKQVKT